MTQTLSSTTIALVKATVPALEAHGLEIVKEMYSRLFQTAEIRDLFNQSNQGSEGAQPRALTAAILAYASNIENLAALAPAVERIAQKHVGLQILPQHYLYVADALLGAIKHVLGDAATDDILAAWGEAYWFLANILIGREASIYDEQRQSSGGWNGWRDFRIDSITQESRIIKSFVLLPVDGGPVMPHKPGQYLTLALDITDHGFVKRNYSISSASNGRSYRITVKQEEGGIASGWLHNQEPGTLIKLAAPAGEFFLPDAPQRPIVLLSGGVGLTPMVAMLEALTQAQSDVPVHFVHGAQDRTTHAMREHVKGLAQGATATIVTNFHQSPLRDEAQSSDYDVEGLITADWLINFTPIATADYYICGPRLFLRAAVSALSLGGVPASRIHYEFFGPADEALAA